MTDKTWKLAIEDIDGDCRLEANYTSEAEAMKSFDSHFRVEKEIAEAQIWLYLETPTAYGDDAVVLCTAYVARIKS